MRIAIDGSAIPKQMAGAGVYTYQLTRALAALKADHEIVAFARPGVFDDVAGLRVVRVGQKNPALRLAWEQTALPILLRRHKIDVLHSPHHHTPVVVGPGIRRVVTINDVTFLILPDRYPPTRRRYMTAVTWAAARVATAVIVPSETVKADVVEHLKLTEERVTVIPDAQGPEFQPASDQAVARVRTKYELNGPFVLSVGSLEPGKNRTRLIKAFAELDEAFAEVQLAIAGQPAWNYEGDQALIKELNLHTRVRFLGYVPDADLPPLYTAAFCSAFPSLYEGFGIPVLESMACGTPVITSNIGSTREIAGDAALLADPYDVVALTGALSSLLGDEEACLDLAARGIERAKQYSWERTAKETMAVYEQVTSG
jgi:glycosyltransferase involved in cell wall biosynthesis